MSFVAFFVLGLVVGVFLLHKIHWNRSLPPGPAGYPIIGVSVQIVARTQLIVTNNYFTEYRRHAYQTGVVDLR
jgi:hypothetical protein